MSIAEQQIPIIYNTTVHKNKSFAFNVTKLLLLKDGSLVKCTATREYEMLILVLSVLRRLISYHGSTRLNPNPSLRDIEATKSTDYGTNT